MSLVILFDMLVLMHSDSSAQCLCKRTHTPCSMYEFAATVHNYQLLSRFSTRQTINVFKMFVLMLMLQTITGLSYLRIEPTKVAAFADSRYIFNLVVL